MICCCAPQNPCVFTVTLLDACTGDPLSGFGVSIADLSGAVVCSGTTNSSGVYTCTLTGTIPSAPTVTISPPA